MCVVTPFEGWVRYLREQEKRRILCAKPETLTAPELQARKDEAQLYALCHLRARTEYTKIVEVAHRARLMSMKRERDWWRWHRNALLGLFGVPRDEDGDEDD